MDIAFNLDDHLPIETSRFILRKLTLDDAGDIFTYGSDPEMSRFVPWDYAKSVDDIVVFIEGALRKYREGGPFDLAIVGREQGRVIGALGYNHWDPVNHWAEMGYAVARAWWGRGVTVEAATALLGLGFGPMGLHRVEAMCMLENARSERVMQKLGMAFECVKRGRMYANGAHHDGKMYYMLNPALLK
ncbi:MAG: GNAT family N-acetyltransferase [Spirochaetes bacterium]|nr:GNAT family N-acetyltransferase [Spirochaetota bacterium]